MAAPKPMERRHLCRILLVALGLSLFFPLFVWRLYRLQWVQHGDYVEKAEMQRRATVRIAPQRGSIFSSGGHPLATSKFLYSAYMAPEAVKDDSLLRRRLSAGLTACLDLPPAEVAGKLDKRGQVFLKRQLEKEKVLELDLLRQELEIPPHALYAVKEGTREYPKGSLASHVIGFTERGPYGDNIGLSGVEAAYDREIMGTVKEEATVKLGGRTVSSIDEEVILSTMGNDVVLTINEAIQHYVEVALAEQVAAFEARGGVCVVLEVGAGAVLAMASNPTFDPNERGEAPVENLKNRCLVDAISPGSVMKVFTSTALIERNKMSPYEEIDCHEGRFVFSMPGGRGYRVKDSHAMGQVLVLKAFTESSNVAFATLGRRLEKQELYDQWKAFRFGERTGIDLPGEEPGMMRPLDKWNEYSRVSLPIGYEITLTPIQVAAAMAAIANRGEYVRPHVLKEIRSPRNEVLYRAKPEVLGRVCSPQTAEIVLGMMERVVLEGTGQLAALPGYRAAGKTGTTVKNDTTPSGEDSEGKCFYASFLGVLPVQAPRLVIYCWIDEPNVRWGSQVAAPLCRKVADHATRILGIRPSEVIPTVADAEETEPDALAEKIAGVEHPELGVPAARGVEFTMPDLTGLTVREAADKLHRLQIDAQLTGWGVAVRQQPAPGEPLPASRALVIFGPPS